jgi:NAD(P)-dependent dehydrogenase (short-subunit alcohol dehydrogenase family)
MSLIGRTALVTGGSRGIGRGIALALAEAGAYVVLTYHRQYQTALEVTREIEQLGGQADVCVLRCEESYGSTQAQIARLVAHYGGFDILVNNAAIIQPKPFLMLTSDDWESMLRINLLGAVACCQAILPGMQHHQWGRIINMASIGGQVGGIGQVHYAASKGALLTLTKSLARLYGKDRITVNAVAPDLVLTEMTREELATPVGQARVLANPLERTATVEEVANVVAWLCSPESSYVNGQCIGVNGGSYMG